MTDVLIRTLRVGEVEADIYEGGIDQRWPDGTHVPGEPHDTDEYRMTARRCGYGTDRRTLCVEHELLHVALGLWLGVPSPVMLDMRGIARANRDVAGCEEDAVLAIQTYLRAVGVDLVSRLVEAECS